MFAVVLAVDFVERGVLELDAERESILAGDYCTDVQ
jgi:hypothetical protein